MRALSPLGIVRTLANVLRAAASALFAPGPGARRRGGELPGGGGREWGARVGGGEGELAKTRSEELLEDARRSELADFDRRLAARDAAPPPRRDGF
jgi:hypothetical protein